MKPAVTQRVEKRLTATRAHIQVLLCSDMPKLRIHRFPVLDPFLVDFFRLIGCGRRHCVDHLPCLALKPTLLSPSLSLCAPFAPVSQKRCTALNFRFLSE